MKKNILVILILLLIVLVIFLIFRNKDSELLYISENIYTSNDYLTYKVCGKKFLEKPLYINNNDVVNTILQNIEKGSYRDKEGPTCDWLISKESDTELGTSTTPKLEFIYSFKTAESSGISEILITTTNSFPMPDYKPVNNTNYYNFIVNSRNGTIEYNSFILNQDSF